MWEGLHARVQRPEEMTELPAPLRGALADALPPALREVSRRTADAGQTTKWLWALDDDTRVETVLMHYPDRVTVCVSTQAGCAMACRFCATGQAGFRRHLTQGEIVEQVAVAHAGGAGRGGSRTSSSWGWASRWPTTTGSGAPSSGCTGTWASRRATSPLSTVGLVPGIRRLATETLPVNLAVSLHAANDDLRDELVPINRRYPLAELAVACADYVAASGRRLSIEWALIDAVNDRDRDAAELAEFARPLGAHVNLIPLNPTPGYPVVGSPPPRVRHFRDQVVALGVNATIRATRGADIDAACGQLAATAPGPAPPVPAGAVRLVRGVRAR